MHALKNISLCVDVTEIHMEIAVRLLIFTGLLHMRMALATKLTNDMKKMIILLFIPLVFNCSDDSNEISVLENPICIELRIGEYYAEDGSNKIILPNEIDGRFDWGQEQDGELMMYGFITQNNCELDFTDTWGNWILTLMDDGNILSEDGSKIYYYID